MPPWPGHAGTEAVLHWIRTQRNDLEPPARAVQPVIGQVLSALSALHGARLARMSGSGATCFALFDDAARARVAAATLQDAFTDWWVMPCTLR
jgi:4-diphosphocytidyl-2-C-methyl-D-erythritol kinase